MEAITFEVPSILLMPISGLHKEIDLLEDEATP
jgi:hypothetical protein